MTWRDHLPPGIKGLKQPRKGGEEPFTMLHFPDRPLRRVLHRDIPSDKECRQIFAAWKNGMERTPSVCSQRPPVEHLRGRVCKASSPTEAQQVQPIRCRMSMSMDGGSTRDSRVLRPPPLDLDRIARNRNRGIRCRSTRLSGATGMMNMPPLQPCQPRRRRPLDATPITIKTTQLQSPRPRSSTNIPPYTCPLCRSATPENDGGLCQTCKADFAMSECGFAEDDKENYPESPVLPMADRCGRAVRYTSSVYSPLVTWPSTSSSALVSPEMPDMDDDDAPEMEVSPCSSRAEGPVSEMTVSMVYRPSHFEAAVIEYDDEVDLYDLEWAEYYFDEDNFHHSRLSEDAQNENARWFMI